MVDQPRPCAPAVGAATVAGRAAGKLTLAGDASKSNSARSASLSGRAALPGCEAVGEGPGCVFGAAFASCIATLIVIK